MGAHEVIFERIVPAIGVVLFLAMSAAPTRTIWRTRKRNDIGDFNPLPCAVLVGNAVCWKAYALVTQDPFIAVSSGGGLLIAVFNTVVLVGQARQRTKDRPLGLLLVYLLTLLVLGAVTSLAHLPAKVTKTMWGVAANTGSIFYYISPMATALKVVRTRDSASIHIGNCAMSIVNCCLWMLYFIAKGDYIIPTTTYYLGGAFNIASLALCWRYPRRKPEMAPLEAELAAGNRGQGHDGNAEHPSSAVAAGPAWQGSAELRARGASSPAGINTEASGRRRQLQSPATAEHGAVGADTASWPSDASWHTTDSNADSAFRGAHHDTQEMGRQDRAGNDGLSSEPAAGAPLTGGHASRQRQVGVQVEELV